MSSADVECTQLKNRQYCAKFIDFASGTFSVWDSTKKYDLEPTVIDGKVHYSLEQLFKALGIEGDVEQLFNPKKAARYINRSPGSLAVWRCTRAHDLEPIKIGRAVRYRQSVLDKFVEEELRP